GRVRQRVAVVAPIGSMEVDEHVRIPRAEHRERGNSLRRLSLYVIAIQIQALSVRARPDERRTVLLRAISLLWGEPFVAIRVVDRNGNEHDGIERVRAIVEQQVAKDRLQRLLSFDLARVNVRLHIYDRTLQSLGLLRRLHEGTRSDHE